MKKNFEIENIGTITVAKNEFSGSFNFYLDNEKFSKTSNKNYVLMHNNEELFITLYGNSFSGFSFKLNDETYIISYPLSWYAYILLFIPFVMGILLGNINPLASQGLYFVGGAIGGLIGGAMTAISYMFLTMEFKWYFKVLIAILSIAITFGVLLGVGMIIFNASK